MAIAVSQLCLRFSLLQQCVPTMTLVASVTRVCSNNHPELSGLPTSSKSAKDRHLWARKVFFGHSRASITPKEFFIYYSTLYHIPRFINKSYAIRKLTPCSQFTTGRYPGSVQQFFTTSVSISILMQRKHYIIHISHVKSTVTHTVLNLGKVWSLKTVYSGIRQKNRSISDDKTLWFYF
jgi:hypothetical protein